MNIKFYVLLLASAVLAGCSTSSQTNSTEESVLPEMQQNTYLSHAKPPQHYGFSAYPVKGGIGMEGAARLHANQLVSVKLLKGGTVPAIRIRGRSPRMKMNALLDTSSPTTWLEFSASQEFGAVFLGMDEMNIPYRGSYNTGDVPGYAAVVTQFRIDQLFVENSPLYVRMAMNSLGPLARGVKVPKIEAVMGYDWLKNFEYVQFNFNAKTVSFSASHPYVPHRDLLMTEAKIVNQPGFGLVVEGAIFGKSTPIVLDFAGDYHFARSDIKVNSTKQVSIVDVVFRKVPTLLLPVNSSPARAGRRMLENYIVTICSRAGVVYFERIPE